MLSRPVDTDATQPVFPPMEKGIYKWQVKDVKEWGSNKDLNISGLVEKMQLADQKEVNVLSLRWQLVCVEDPRYDGSSGTKPQTRYYFTTYWASPEKIDESYQNSVNKYVQENPTATQEDIDKYVRKWKPQINTFEFLHACGLMERQEEDQQVEFLPIGWEFDKMEDAVISALGSVVYGKIDSQTVGERTYKDALVQVSQVREK